MNRTPHEHAVARGLYRAANPLIPQAKAHYKWQHAVADHLHGWTRDAYHYQAEPFTLSDEDYDAAIEAAKGHPNTPAHEPAIPVRS